MSFMIDLESLPTHNIIYLTEHGTKAAEVIFTSDIEKIICPLSEEDKDISTGSWWDKIYPDKYVCHNCRHNSSYNFNFCPNCGKRMINSKISELGGIRWKKSKSN